MQDEAGLFVFSEWYTFLSYLFLGMSQTSLKFEHWKQEINYQSSPSALMQVLGSHPLTLATSALMTDNLGFPFPLA